MSRGAVMGFPTSPELRWSIVHTWKACKSISLTAKQLHLPYATVKRWVERYRVYAGITPYGMTKLHEVAGTSQQQTTFHNKHGSLARNITADEYEHVLEVTLLPEGTRLFSSNGISSWVFQQDNDPTHRSAADVILKYNRRHGTSISLLPNWPPNSPDLSLIENVWGYMQARLNARGCKTFQEFQAAVHEEARGISRDHARSLFASMGQRLRSCIQNGGDRTRY